MSILGMSQESRVSCLLPYLVKYPETLREEHTSAKIGFWAVSSCDSGNEGFWGDEYMGLSKLYSETLSGNGFLLSFGLEAHPCSAFTSPGANMAQPENWRVAIRAARHLSRHQGDYGDGVVVRKSRLAAEEPRCWIAGVQRSPPPRVSVNPQTLAGVGAVPRERRAPAVTGSLGGDGVPALRCFFSYLGCRTWDAPSSCRATL